MIRGIFTKPSFLPLAYLRKCIPPKRLYFKIIPTMMRKNSKNSQPFQQEGDERFWISARLAESYTKLEAIHEPSGWIVKYARIVWIAGPTVHTTPIPKLQKRLTMMMLEISNF